MHLYLCYSKGVIAEGERGTCVLSSISYHRNKFGGASFLPLLPTVTDTPSPSPKVIGDAPVPLLPRTHLPLCTYPVPQRGKGVQVQGVRGKGVRGKGVREPTFGSGERGMG